MNKKIFTFLLSAIVGFSAFAQTEKCGTMPNHFSQLQNSAQYAETFSAAEKLAKKWLDENKGFANAKTQQLVVTIPVVFHCIYKNTTDVTYLHDSIFTRQIAIMNETYSLSNPNFSNTRAIFDSLGVNIDLQFCLANVDTNGNPFSGIDRQQNNANWFSSILNNQIKTTYPPWDPAHYLNIWTCDMSLFGNPFVLGFATFPGGPANLDGVVLQAEFVGYQNNGTVNNLGRTMVHEVGHWLGMRHIWGDGQQGTNPCDSTDYVEDTPRANNASQTDCDTTKNTCSNEDPFWSNFSIDPPDMVENYMDYSSDACMTMFTKGQKARMWSFINTVRTGLLNNTVGCTAVGIDEYNPAFGDYIHVYPNPANNVLNLNFTSGNLNEIQVELYDANGRLVKAFKPLSFQHALDVKGMKPGIYFLKIANLNNVAVKKVILQ